MPPHIAVILGMVQGVTEFLPISSDGHLVLADMVLKVTLAPRDALGFDILLHGGSLLALLALTGRRWWELLRSCAGRPSAKGLSPRDARRLVGLIIVATVPGAFAGLFLGDAVASQRTELAAAAGFVATALVLMIGELIAKQRGGGETHLEHLRLRHAIIIGCAQAVALLPGVSRSGMTISVALALLFTRRAAFEFSFLLAAPIIAGAVAKGVLDMWLGDVAFPGILPAAAGFASSAVVSAIAYVVLRAWVTRRSLAWFAAYLLPLAAVLAMIAIDPSRLHDPAYLRTLVERYGAMALFFFSVLEVTPPFSFISPGIVVLIVAGSLATDVPTLTVFILAATAGALLGTSALYWIGRGYGLRVAHRLHLSNRHVGAADNFLRRFGVLSLVIGQFIGLTRPAIAFVAGTVGMRRRVFLPCTVVATGLWAIVYILLGHLARASLEIILPVIGFGGLLVMAVLVGWATVLRLMRR